MSLPNNNEAKIMEDGMRKYLQRAAMSVALCLGMFAASPVVEAQGTNVSGPQPSFIYCNYFFGCIYCNSSGCGYGTP
jgi:hypothetical protein